MSHPIFEEVQEAPWPLSLLGLGSTALGGMAVAKGLGRLGQLGVAGATVAVTSLILRELIHPMRTTLYPDELHIRFGKRTRFRIPLQNVVHAEAREYRPLAEYGGWGIRWGSAGRAFSMRGNRGVQLILRSGQRVLVGSERPEELAAALRNAMGGSATTVSDDSNDRETRETENT